jgi:hypothetical protein
MKTTILAKLAGLVAVGAVAAGGLNIAGAIPGPLGNGGGDNVPEPAQQGQTFAAAMQEWAACVAAAAPAHDPADGEFDPVAACGERPHPSDFDEIGDPDENGTLPEPAQQGQAFAAAMQEWAACVGEAAAAREDAGEDAGRFDPFEACGDLPHPSDFGIGGGAPEGTPTGAPESIPTGAPEGTPTGAPEGTPTGAPESIPTGAPEATPTGAPEATPTGAPEATPTGAPDGTPTGAPDGTPTGAPDGTPTGAPSGVPAGRP